MKNSIEIVSHELTGFEPGFDAKISKEQEVLLKDPGVESRFSPPIAACHFVGNKNILTSVPVWYDVWSALIYRLYQVWEVTENLLPKRTQNTTCPNYVPLYWGYLSCLESTVVREICKHLDLLLLCNAALAVRQAPSSSKKEVCNERERREKGPLYPAGTSCKIPA